jgi:hypothetical protein
LLDTSNSWEQDANDSFGSSPNPDVPAAGVMSTDMSFVTADASASTATDSSYPFKTEVIDNTSDNILVKGDANVLDYTSMTSFGNNFMGTAQTGGELNVNVMEPSATWMWNHTASSTLGCTPTNTPSYMPMSILDPTAVPTLDLSAQSFSANPATVGLNFAASSSMNSMSAHELGQATTNTAGSPMVVAHYDRQSAANVPNMSNWYMEEEAQKQCFWPSKHTSLLC